MQNKKKTSQAFCPMARRQLALFYYLPSADNCQSPKHPNPAELNVSIVYYISKIYLDYPGLLQYNLSTRQFTTPKTSATYCRQTLMGYVIRSVLSPATFNFK